MSDDTDRAPGERATALTDPRALRAYAHPTRMTLVGLLRREGPLTATRAAELTGESVASCSYHLRQLAKYGLVEEDEGGQGRKKPWKAAARFTTWPSHSDDPVVAAASDVLSEAIGEKYFEHLRCWLDVRARQPRAWQEAALLGDRTAYLTPAELTGLGEDIDALLARYEGRDDDPASRPGDSRLVNVIRMAFPAGELPPPGAGRTGTQEE